MTDASVLSTWQATSRSAKSYGLDLQLMGDSFRLSDGANHSERFQSLREIEAFISGYAFALEYIADKLAQSGPSDQDKGVSDWRLPQSIDVLA